MLRPVLEQLWEASDFLCSKRLAPYLPELLEALERHEEVTVSAQQRTALRHVSPATIDRLLRPVRRFHRRHGLATSSRSVAVLRAQVPLRTFGEWANVPPGTVQADLLGHCGETTAGFYLTSLLAVDVATGWTESRAVWGKGYKRVAAAVYFIRQAVPMPLQALHTDNGGEFLNQMLLGWARRLNIRQTRGRPYRKNDQAYVEQKNSYAKTTQPRINALCLSLSPSKPESNVDWRQIVWSCHQTPIRACFAHDLNMMWAPNLDNGL
jgi:transposase InsO family protein